MVDKSILTAAGNPNRPLTPIDASRSTKNSGKRWTVVGLKPKIYAVKKIPGEGNAKVFLFPGDQVVVNLANCIESIGTIERIIIKQGGISLAISWYYRLGELERVMKYTGNTNQADRKVVRRLKKLSPHPLVATNHVDIVDINSVQRRCLAIEDRIFQSIDEGSGQAELRHLLRLQTDEDAPAFTSVRSTKGYYNFDKSVFTSK